MGDIPTDRLTTAPFGINGYTYHARWDSTVARYETDDIVTDSSLFSYRGHYFGGP